MPTECSRELFEFEAVEGRRVVAAFDGGAITSDAGALLLGATDRAIGLIERFAGCFTDGARPGAGRAQRRDAGRAAGLRHRAGLRGPERPRRAAPRSGAGGAGRQARGQAHGLRAAGRQEHAEPAGACAGRTADRYHKIGHDARGDRGAVRRSVPRRASARRRSRSSSTSMPPTIRCTATRRAGSSTATTTATATCRSTSSAAGICWRPSCGARTSTPRPARSRRWRASSARSARAGRRVRILLRAD